MNMNEFRYWHVLQNDICDYMFTRLYSTISQSYYVSLKLMWEHYLVNHKQKNPSWVNFISHNLSNSKILKYLRLLENYILYIYSWINNIITAQHKLCGTEGSEKNVGRALAFPALFLVAFN